MTSLITKTIVLQSSVPVRAFDNDGVISSSADLQAFTPVVFNNINSNDLVSFDLTNSIRCNYLVDFITVDVTVDDDKSNSVNQIDNRASFSTKLSIAIIESEVRKANFYLQIHDGKIVSKDLILRPNQTVELKTSTNLNSVTFWCQPCFIEPTIELLGTTVFSSSSGR